MNKDDLKALVIAGMTAAITTPIAASADYKPSVTRESMMYRHGCCGVDGLSVGLNKRATVEDFQQVELLK